MPLTPNPSPLRGEGARSEAEAALGRFGGLWLRHLAKNVGNGLDLMVVELNRFRQLL